MYIIKLYTGSGKFIGQTEEEDIDDAMEIVKGHLTSNDTICVIADEEYIGGIEII